MHAIFIEMISTLFYNLTPASYANKDIHISSPLLHRKKNYRCTFITPGTEFPGDKSTTGLLAKTKHHTKAR